ncbi:hypothetical protein ACGFSB_24970 [Streptomyces sp. NPDC048441]|uniref:hypothetical protein n=1 Tax=Streptomyces sp. NPDC048441 TaxID=3365552 RepID=UPI00371FD0E4
MSVASVGHHPQVRLVLLIACCTRGILDALLGPRRDNEVALAKQLATIPTLPCPAGNSC